ncbi:Heterokaryon incompatibility protein (HET) domain containing protein [Elaphomyces granulatus]|jgi:hypothetical protein
MATSSVVPRPVQNPTSQTSEGARIKYYRITKDQTRLLQIHRGKLHDKITLSIKTVVIDKLGPEPYEYGALSYHWGERLHENPILVQNSSDSGQGETTSIPVKANLYTALQYLRRDDSDVLMWVDAICINQHDEEEKTAQIARMWEIYRKATGVCIWLGEGEKSSYDAMKFITEIVDSESDDIFRDKERIPQWRDLANLMRNDWFSRRWVVQEVALAEEANVHCGQEVVHWDDFRDAISLVAIHSDTIQGLFETIEDLDTLSAKALVDITSNIFRNNEEPAFGLEYLVWALDAFECSDPRDTIFALQNIACETSRLKPENGDRQPPEPDYSKRPFEVYRDFVRWAIQTSKSLDIICRPWALPEQMKGENKLNNSTKHDPSNRDPPATCPPKRAERHPPRRIGQRLTSEKHAKRLPPKPHPPRPHPKPTSEKHAPREHEKEDWPSLSKTLPSWIPAYERQNKGGGKKGASFVGPPGQSTYNASNKKEPDFRFHTPQRSWLNSVITRISAWFKPTGGGYGPPKSWAQFEPNDALPTTHADKSLYVKGLIIGQITWTSEPITNGVIPESCLEKAGLIREKTQEVCPDKLWRTLVADRDPAGRLPPRWYHRACLYCLNNSTDDININVLLKNTPAKNPPTKTLPTETHPPKYVKKYLERVQAVVRNRKFLEVEKEKLFGLCSDKARSDDIVCVLFGCSVPVVLRKRDEKDGGGYLFIEEAYIHGKMDGQAINAEDLREQTIEFKLI